MKTESATKEIKATVEPAEQKLKKIREADAQVSEKEQIVATISEQLKEAKTEREEAIANLHQIISDDQMTMEFVENE
jgi:outer membrane protein TolC